MCVLFSLSLVLAITCQKPEAEAQMVIQCSKAELQLNATCSFSCESGFDLQGANTVKCSEDGRWSEALPACKGMEARFSPQSAHFYHLSYHAIHPVLFYNCTDFIIDLI